MNLHYYAGRIWRSLLLRWLAASTVVIVGFHHVRVHAEDTSSGEVDAPADLDSDIDVDVDCIDGDCDGVPPDADGGPDVDVSPDCIDGDCDGIEPDADGGPDLIPE
jgi:hypothetical protein